MSRHCWPRQSGSGNHQAGQHTRDAQRAGRPSEAPCGASQPFCPRGCLRRISRRGSLTRMGCAAQGRAPVKRPSPCCYCQSMSLEISCWARSIWARVRPATGTCVSRAVSRSARVCLSAFVACRDPGEVHARQPVEQDDGVSWPELDDPAGHPGRNRRSRYLIMLGVSRIQTGWRLSRRQRRRGEFADLVPGLAGGSSSG